jgi:hypothetical protein
MPSAHADLSMTCSARRDSCGLQNCLRLRGLELALQVRASFVPGIDPCVSAFADKNVVCHSSCVAIVTEVFGLQRGRVLTETRTTTRVCIVNLRRERARARDPTSTRCAEGAAVGARGRVVHPNPTGLLGNHQSADAHGLIWLRRPQEARATYESRRQCIAFCVSEFPTSARCASGSV